MLYYGRVHLVMDFQLFLSLWLRLGSDDLSALLKHDTVTSTLTPEFAGVHNQTSGGVITHRAIIGKLAGSESTGLLRDKDTAGVFIQALGNSQISVSRKRMNAVLALTKATTFKHLLGDLSKNDQMFLSLASDSATLKMFIESWSSSDGLVLNPEALDAADIRLIDMGDNEVIVMSSVPLEFIVRSDGDPLGWGSLLGTIQDYGIDLHLSNSLGADIITTEQVGDVAYRRLDLSLQRAFSNQARISEFQEFAFEDAKPFAHAVNSGALSFREALRIVDQSRKFRDWVRDLPPTANLIREYHEAISRETPLSSLPASVSRFSFFTGAGLLADAATGGSGVGTALGLGLSAFDAFVVDRLARGWRPNVFVENLERKLQG